MTRTGDNIVFYGPSGRAFPVGLCESCAGPDGDPAAGITDFWTGRIAISAADCPPGERLETLAHELAEIWLRHAPASLRPVVANHDAKEELAEWMGLWFSACHRQLAAHGGEDALQSLPAPDDFH